jgi:peptide/nickel transport system permease protein
MLALIGRRLFMMVLTMVAMSFLLFVIFEGDKYRTAISALGAYSTVEQRLLWMAQNGLDRPFFTRYFEWLLRFLTGDFGTSIQFNTPVADLLGPALLRTLQLGALVFCLTMVISLFLGVLSGIAEGSPRDRLISIVSVLTTSIPEFASATIFIAVFVYWLGWLPGTSSMASGFHWAELILPVTVLVVFNFGYYVRMMRASMAEVMQSQYVRTAILKGMPWPRVIMKHALRNALIAPFTVMVLQINYLLSGVIVTEVIFAYPGFGRRLYEAAQFGDIFVVEACAMVAVALAVATQFISEVGYIVLNPRIRVVWGGGQ